MKWIIAAILLFLFIVIEGCIHKKQGNMEDSQIFPSELVEFIPYEGNPVFTGSGQNTWDHFIRERGYILREDGIYKMWYTGYSDSAGSTKYLGYATSTDGYQWTRYSGNPIIKEYWTEDVCVVKHNGQYFMIAEGVGDIAHMLTSTDGINWQRKDDLDIRKMNGEPLSPGPYGTPTLWIEDGKWFLYYERDDQGIWLAVSTDLEVWTNVQDDPVIRRGPEPYDAEAVALNQIVKYQGRYYAFYHGSPDTDWATWNSNIAVSDDLIHWIKYSQNPIMRPDSLNKDISSPILVHDGNQYRLYAMHGQVRVFLPKK
ncbi:MAG TPA: hypothetical protein VI583_00765 [Cyclobacteriaceae bacterium]|nr:hypothetical protein [Cyclobacteriaceae bacterium]